MEKRFTIGLGIIHAEDGEIRVFLPEFVSKISRYFNQVVLETGYGESLGVSPEFYTKPDNVHFAPPEEIYDQDYVLVLRYPPDTYLNMMQPGGCLISMCHFPTRPKRRETLREKGIEAISLDSIVDDNANRLVENLRSVAWNGCEIAFKVLHQIWPEPGLADPNRTSLNVTLLGSGGVGGHAVQAAIRYGDANLWHQYAAQNIPGNIVRVIDYDLTSHEAVLMSLLKDTHLLIDATQRKNSSEFIIPNRLIGLMPEPSVILDLSVDPYDFGTQPNEVKGIEGIPQGDLNQYIFAPDDPVWDELPKQINTTYRRWVVSCYSWPGIHPRSCMLRYGNQITPLLRRLVSAGGIDGIHPGGRYHDRALARSMLKYWEE